MSKIIVIHENDAWLAPLSQALERRGLPWQDWHLDRGTVDLAAVPPAGVFYNRMSASAHTRGHRYAPELTSAVLAWLEAHGRRIANGSRALALEVNKAAQYAALYGHGLAVPRSMACVGTDAVIDAVRGFDNEVILKHNRAGKGLGVKLCGTVEEASAYLSDPATEQPVDGIWLVQQYIRSPDQAIVRMEFIGGKFFYAVRVDTSHGFELCPADVCRVGDNPRPLFEILDGFSHALIAPVERLLQANDIAVCGVEFITDTEGSDYIYDINTNTNYNAQAEAVAGLYGMDRLAEFLGRELAALKARPVRAA